MWYVKKDRGFCQVPNRGRCSQRRRWTPIMSGAWQTRRRLAGRARTMDRLIRLALSRSIRAGNLRVTTARGATYTLGDGTGPPVALRFATRAAERSVILHPDLKL